jgi:hypothetical protein
MPHEDSFRRLPVTDLPLEWQAPLTRPEAQQLADSLGVPLSDMRTVVVMVAPETPLGWSYQRWLHGQHAIMGFNGSQVVGVLMVSLPDFLRDHGMVGLRMFETHMFEHGRPGQFSRLTWSAAAQRVRG